MSFFIKVNHVAVFVLLSADWCLTSRYTKHKKSAFTVWRAKHANERRILAQESAGGGPVRGSIKCRKGNIKRDVTYFNIFRELRTV